MGARNQGTARRGPGRPRKNTVSTKDDDIDVIEGRKKPAPATRNKRARTVPSRYRESADVEEMDVDIDTGDVPIAGDAAANLKPSASTTAPADLRLEPSGNRPPASRQTVSPPENESLPQKKKRGDAEAENAVRNILGPEGKCSVNYRYPVLTRRPRVRKEVDEREEEGRTCVVCRERLRHGSR